ncbi:hypothetical protein MRX96_035413 [Rhipicephalus microplus]
MRDTLLLALLLGAVAVANSDENNNFPSWKNYGKGGARCARAFDLQLPFRVRCRYLCKGWPVRAVNEADGEPCAALFRGTGTCQNGRCVVGSSTSSVTQPDTEFAGRGASRTDSRDKHRTPTVNPKDHSLPLTLSQRAQSM